MKSFSYPFSSFIFFFIIIFFFFIHGFTSQNLIQETCKTCSQDDPNIEFDFCNNSLQAALLPNTNTSQSATTTLHSLGKISIKLIANNVSSTTLYIKNLLNKNKTLLWDPFVKECLRDCLEVYNDAILCTKEAIFCYDSSRFIDVNAKISSVMDAANTCEDGFSEKTGVVSPLTKRNNITFELSALSLGLMRMLQT